MKITATEHANAILAFLQNIEDEEEAYQFVNIAIDAQERAAAATNQEYDRAEVLASIADVDARVHYLLPENSRVTLSDAVWNLDEPIKCHTCPNLMDSDNYKEWAWKRVGDTDEDVFLFCPDCK